MYAGGYGSIGAHLRASLKLNDEGDVEFVDEDGVALPAHAGILSTVINLTNTVMGSGILTLPFALRCAGWVGGVGILGFAVLMSAWSFWVLTVCVQQSAKFSFRGMVESTLGKTAGTATQLFIIAYTAFASIGYLVLLGDFFTSGLGFWLSSGSLFLNRQFVIACMGVILLPFAFLKNLHALRHTSFFGVAAIMYVVFIVVYLFATKYEGKLDDSVEKLNETPRFFLAFPLTVISFTAQFNLPAFYGELSDRTPRRMMICVGITMFWCFAVYTLVALLGYFTFGTETKADILESYARSNEFVLAARIAMAVNILSTYPLINHALRANVQDFLFAKAAHSFKQLVTIGIVSTLSFAAIAIVVPNISTVVDYNGSINGVAIVYIIPAAALLVITRGLPGQWLSRGFARFAAVIGVLFGLLGLVFTTLNLVDQSILDK